MKAFTTAAQNRCAARPHPSLCRRSGRVGANPPRSDERNQTGILTFGLNLVPAFPTSFASRSVAMGACIPSQWRNRPRITRGSLAI
jgi:hypothetical protein